MGILRERLEVDKGERAETERDDEGTYSRIEKERLRERVKVEE